MVIHFNLLVDFVKVTNVNKINMVMLIVVEIFFVTKIQLDFIKNENKGPYKVVSIIIVTDFIYFIKILLVVSIHYDCFFITSIIFFINIITIYKEIF